MPSAEPPVVLGAPAAVLWDMDGLLVDSEPLWTVAETELAAAHDRAWTEAAKAACIGRRLDAAVPAMLGALGLPVAPADLAAAEAFLLARMIELFTSRPLPLQPGAADLLAALSAAGVPCALVSSSFRVLVDAVVSALTAELGASPFAVTLGGDEVGRAKPDPEPYVAAAALLGVAPGDCVVLEDTVSGATAGVAAGCRTFLVPSLPATAAAGGWQTVSSLADLVPG